MKKQRSQFLITGVFLFFGGLISEVLAARKMIFFLHHYSGVSRMGMGEMALGLILPHMVMLISLGIICYGFVLITQALRGRAGD